MGLLAGDRAHILIRPWWKFATVVEGVRQNRPLEVFQSVQAVCACFVHEPVDMLKKLSFVMCIFGAAYGVSDAYAKNCPGGPSIGLEIGPNFVPNDQGTNESVGVGFAGRLGYELRSGLVFITPEVKLGFESPGTPEAFRLMGGARAGIATAISPYAFGHIGGLVGGLEGFAWDLGAGLDFDVGPLGIGAFVSYNRAENQELSLETFW